VRIVVIDNYDSFTFNLVQALGALGNEVVVYRNDAVTVESVAWLAPDRIVISPGPGRPENAGISCDVVRAFADTTWVLGVCLGHQCIGHVFGMTVVQAPEIMHGKSSWVLHDGKDVHYGVPNPFSAMRYHSLALREDDLPPGLEISARTLEGTVMGLRHQSLKLIGVQYHPESFLTPDGPRILQNFLELPP
jgi:anthranilate synthase/aminodeoxychorismate synthase-like glutamine amidotransferase